MKSKRGREKLIKVPSNTSFKAKIATNNRINSDFLDEQSIHSFNPTYKLVNDQQKKTSQHLA